MIGRTTLLASLTVVGFGAMHAVQAVEVKNLRCEYRVDPLGIDVGKPRLSWMLESVARSERQTAFQILVASTPEMLAQNEGDLWDSGKVTSDRSAHVEYNGRLLNSGQRCWWKVRVWDKDEHPSGWSISATWTMGLLKAEDWRAQWIGPCPVDAQPLASVLGFAVEAHRADQTQWVQVDLGTPQKIDRVVLHPMHHEDPAA